MKILIADDTEEKTRKIRDVIEQAMKGHTLRFDVATSLQISTKKIYEETYDLIILDLMMPQRDGDLPIDVTNDIISCVELSDKNKMSNFIALSSYTEMVGENQQRFSESGALTVHFDDNDEWIKHLSAYLLRMRQKMGFDFIVICALEKEREAFRKSYFEVHELRNIQALDCLTVKIGNMHGACIKMPRMGLVNASIITTQAIERFSPKLVAMSGICAGIVGETEIGTLVVADTCWEHQAGKWSEDGFKIEHYDVSLETNIKTTISQFFAEDKLGHKYKKDLPQTELNSQQITIAPFTSGSSVIASDEKLADIGIQHRKVAGLDMEMYGVYQACELSSSKPLFFGAKTVVDLANSNKGDEYHEAGSVLSARFVSDAIKHILEG